MLLDRNTDNSNLLLAPLAVIALLLAAYSALVFRDYRAQCWMRSGSLSGLERSVALAPRNAQALDLLGRANTFALQDPSAGLALLRRAVALDAHNSRFWLDIAASERMAADLPGQRDAVAHALLIDPNTPAVAWEAGNLALADGDTDNALDRFRTVVASDAVLAPSALTLAWRSTQDLPRILSRSVPPTPAAYSTMLDVLLDQHAYDSLSQLFAAMEVHGIALPAPRAMVAANAALHSGQPELALRIWMGIARSDPGFADYLPTPTNAIVNPGFESELLNTGFDWTLTPVPGVATQLSSGDAHSGERSLRLDFPGVAWGDAGVSQLVLLRPTSAYAFTFWAKSEDLMGASPPLLCISDESSKAGLYRSSALLTAGVWKQFNGTLHTLPATHLVRVSITRDLPSTLIRGRLSLDDFSIAEVR